MRDVIWLLILWICAQCQIKIITHRQKAQFVLKNNITAIDLNWDGSEVMLAGFNSVVRIDHYNVTNGSNVTMTLSQYGSFPFYANPYPDNASYNYIYQVKNYMIASNSKSYSPRIFYIDTQTTIGSFDIAMDIVSLKYVKSRDIILYGTSSGVLFWANMSSFPNPRSIAVYDLGGLPANAIVEVSSDEQYFSLVYQGNNTLVIFHMANLTIARSLRALYNSSTQIWSPDSRYLAVFPCCDSSITFYDRDNNWTFFQKLAGQSGIQFSFNYLETGVLVMVPSANNHILTMNWYDFTFRLIVSYYFYGKLGKVSSNNMAFGVFQQNTTIAWFFQILPFCSTNQQYIISNKTCINNPVNCLNWTNYTICTKCAANYQLVDSSCLVCGNDTIYNATTMHCDLIELNCSGDQYFSSLQRKCVQCQVNCVNCSSLTTCGTCALHYLLINGTCQMLTCSSSQFIDYASFSCQSCSFNCIQCYTPSECISCEPDKVLSNGKCISTNQVAFGQILKATLQNQALKTTNQIPGNRVLFSQIFSFFINIDHLWLYIYHKRQYGSIINNFLTSVNSMEQQKWNMISNDILTQKIGIPYDSIQSELDFKKNQTSWKFLEIQKQSSSFLENTLNFFFLNIPIIFVLYLCFRGIFFMSYSYKISSLFREYAFDMFYLYMIFQGNMECFTYFIFYDFITMINFEGFDKMINILTLVLAFGFFIYVFAGQMIIYGIQGRNSRYFMKDFKIGLQSTYFATIQVGFLNFALGACHILAEKNYQIQLIILASIETIYIFFLIIGLKSSNIFKKKYVGWQYILGSIFRVVLIFTFSMDQGSERELREVFNQIQIVIIILYLTNWIFSIVVGYGESLWKFAGYLKNQILGIKEKIKKNIQTKTVIKQKASRNSVFSIKVNQIKKSHRQKQQSREQQKQKILLYSKKCAKSVGHSKFKPQPKEDQASILGQESKKIESRSKTAGFSIKNLLRLKNQYLNKENENYENLMKRINTVQSNDGMFISRKNIKEKSIQKMHLSLQKNQPHIQLLTEKSVGYISYGEKSAKVIPQPGEKVSRMIHSVQGKSMSQIESPGMRRKNRKVMNSLDEKGSKYIHLSVESTFTPQNRITFKELNLQDF